MTPPFAQLSLSVISVRTLLSNLYYTDTLGIRIMPKNLKNKKKKEMRMTVCPKVHQPDFLEESELMTRG